MAKKLPSARQDSGMIAFELLLTFARPLPSEVCDFSPDDFPVSNLEKADQPGLQSGGGFRVTAATRDQFPQVGKQPLGVVLNHNRPDDNVYSGLKDSRDALHQLIEVHPGGRSFNGGRHPEPDPAGNVMYDASVLSQYQQIAQYAFGSTLHVISTFFLIYKHRRPQNQSFPGAAGPPAIFIARQS
jgi:hypothetical protein